MPRERKTIDIYELHVKYDSYHGWEHELTEYSLWGYCNRRREYRENCPQYPVKLVRRRVRKEDAGIDPAELNKVRQADFEEYEREQAKRVTVK
jgi:hypothetical protein